MKRAMKPLSSQLEQHVFQSREQTSATSSNPPAAHYTYITSKLTLAQKSHIWPLHSKDI